MQENKHMAKTQIASNAEESMALRGYIDATKLVYNFSDSMVLKCAVELRIADIIHSNGHPLTLFQIASSISSPSLNVSHLHRIMRMLVRMKIFTIDKSNNEDTLIRYGLTPTSNALLHDNEFSLAPMLLLQTHPVMLSVCQHLTDCVMEGGSGFKKAHGCEVFEMASANPEMNKMFNAAMSSTVKINTKAIFATCRDIFSGIGSLVDVGGGVGQMMAEIVKEFKDIKGINFDLAHVVEMAPKLDRVTHVAGDMFIEIPSADAILMKHILHDWDDEDCVKILKNCKSAVKKEGGKVIIIDIIMKEDEEEEGLFGYVDSVLDILMMAHCAGGKERTKLEWKDILEEAGFMNHNIIQLPCLASLIEAFPK